MKEKGATVAIIGSGGAEAALVHKYSQSPHVEKILGIPGNDMMQEVSEKPVDTFPEADIANAVTTTLLCRDEGADLVVIRQEEAIAAGLANMLKVFRIPTEGPTQEAGRIESDKDYARVLGDYLKLPQPKHRSFSTLQEAERFLSEQDDSRWFVKASGLAKGKGGVPATSKQEAIDAFRWLKSEFPEASKTILIEEWIDGEELSALAVSDSRNFKILGYAQDHKRALDNDQGENTGGMGAVSHPILANDQELREGIEAIIKPVIDARLSGGFRGILFPGIMVVEVDGKLKPILIEFNARWGDPEAEVIVPGLLVDFFEMGIEAARGTLRRVKISDDGKVRVAVAGVSKGYPRDYSEVRGKEIRGFEDARRVDGITLYGAAVKVEDGKYFANGGRLFYVVGEGEDVIQARERAYEAMERISVEGNNLHYRTDIGWRDVERMRGHEQSRRVERLRQKSS